jgi:hypothetical protein
VQEAASGDPRASIVIPAHDEEGGIGRCLSSLASTPDLAQVEVVVVANGCTDRTAEAARAFAGEIPRLTVLELAEASKIAALNAGDAACHAFPRIYLDADVLMSGDSVDALIAALDTQDPRVASPHVVFDTSGANVAVRAFYRAYGTLPYVREGLIGLGVYAVSRAGRSRFEEFPDVTGDDLFVQRLFAPAERATSSGTFVVQTPRTIGDLVRVRTRVAQGNAQLARFEAPALSDNETTTTRTLRALLDEVRRQPRLAPAAAVYVAVVLAARVKARRSDDGAWLRDESSRAATHGAHDAQGDH